MSDSRRGDGNGAVVAIVMVFGIVILGGLILVVGSAFWLNTTQVQTLAMAPAATAAVPAPVASSTTGSGSADAVNTTSDAEQRATPPTSPAQLPIEVDAGDQILVNGVQKTLDELKRTFKDIKNGNSPFTEIKIKFAGSSDARTDEVFAVLKEACILYEVDPAGKVPAAAATP